nr:uncharacterized protein LOC123774564 isoform X2 [Procambarus clarkii]
MRQIEVVLYVRKWKDVISKRSCRWNQSHSECSKATSNPSKVTSALWKQLSEECDTNIKAPLSHATYPTDKKVSPNERNTSINNSSFQSQDLWHTLHCPASLQNDFNHQIMQKDPWEPLTTDQGSHDLTDIFNSNFTDDIFRKSNTDVNVISIIGNEENIYPSFFKDMSDNKFDSSVTCVDVNDSTNPISQLFPSNPCLADSIWNESSKTPADSAFPFTSGKDSCGLHTSMSWDNAISSGSQKRVLQDLETNNQCSVIGPPKTCHPYSLRTARDFVSSHKLPSSCNAGVPESYSNQGATVVFPQKQHTDLVALMQELSMIVGATDAGHLLQDGSMLHAYTQQKTPVMTPVTTTSKGCVFCKNNNYHSTFYKSHSLKPVRLIQIPLPHQSQQLTFPRMQPTTVAQLPDTEAGLLSEPIGTELCKKTRMNVVIVSVLC